MPKKSSMASCLTNFFLMCRLVLAPYRIGFLLLPFAALVPQGLRAEPQPVPSFDCAKATTATENLICRDPKLAAEDRAMADAYYAVLQHLRLEQNTSFRREHYEWSLGYRKACNSPDMMDDGRRGVSTFILTKHTQELQAKLASLTSESTSNAPPAIVSAHFVGRSSSVERLVPQDFDRTNAYGTYSVDELRAAIADASDKNTSFVGQQIKVFAKY